MVAASALPDPPGSTFTQAWGINDQGLVVGAYADANFDFSRLRAGGAMVPVV
jgi:hypothetical protein